MPPVRKPPDEPGFDASLFGIADTELLAIVDDLADENGWTATIEVRLQLGEDIEAVGRRSGIGGRLGWMRRYGWLEREPGPTSNAERRWRLTAFGHAVLDDGDLSKSFQNALSKLNPAQRVKLTREISESGANSADEVRNALRREWQRNLNPRRPRAR